MREIVTTTDAQTPDTDAALALDWEPRAATLAAAVAHPRSRWRNPLEKTPRHLFTSSWWGQDESTGWAWAPRHGCDDPARWLAAAYADQTLVTAVAGRHADHATSTPLAGLPTSSGTLPSLLVRMFQYAHLDAGDTVLDIGTGTGYGTALLCRRLGDLHVMAVDSDAYVTEAARDRLAALDLHPQLATLDATADELHGTVDRIISTVAVRSIPATWLAALRPGGRLVTTIAGTSLVITADKTPDGGATGRVEWQPAMFISADACTGAAEAILDQARHADGDVATTSPYPACYPGASWDLGSMLALNAMGIEYSHSRSCGIDTVVLAHPDGSWARATGTATDPATVHQAGPRRLWDDLDRIRTEWLHTGDFPVRGARVDIAPGGTTRISRGHWSTTL